MIVDFHQMRAAASAILSLMESLERNNQEYIFVDVNEAIIEKFLLDKINGLRIHPRIVQTAKDIGSDPRQYTKVIQEMIANGLLSANFLDPDYDHGNGIDEPVNVHRLVMPETALGATKMSQAKKD